MTRRSLLLSISLLPALSLWARPVRGARYVATRRSQTGPLVFDLSADERWPIRNVDPVLHIGNTAIEAYQYANTEGTLLRFTCYQPNDLQDGAAVYLQFGQDADSRTPLPDFLLANVR